jgi:hypothetical protein
MVVILDNLRLKVKVHWHWWYLVLQYIVIERNCIYEF